MSGHVYHPFTQNDSLTTTIWTQPSLTWWAVTGTNVTFGSTLGFPSGSLSLYGGVRARVDVFSGSSPIEIYPLDDVDTHSIDKVIQVSGQYPATGSIHLVLATNQEAPNGLFSVTETRWFDEHYRPIELLYNFYGQFKSAYRTSSYYDGFGSFDVSDQGVCRVFDIPSMHYDRQIVPGSVIFTDWTKDGTPQVFLDDGRGSLYLSGAFDSGYPAKFGNIFYVEGLIVINRLYPNGSPVGYGMIPGDPPNNNNSGAPFYRSIQLSLSGSHPIVCKTLMCRAGQGELNASNNPTWSFQDPADGLMKRIGPDNTTYITAIGLYDQDRKLIAVAKLAQPIRKREKDSLNIRLRLDM